MSEHDKPYSEVADIKSWSLKDVEPITIAGSWNAEWNLPLPEPQERKVVIRGGGIRALGIDWWLWKTEFTAIATANDQQDADGMVTVGMNFTPTTIAITTKSEWWRSLGYYIIARPYEWVADHTVRPFARWVLDIPSDDDA